MSEPRIIVVGVTGSIAAYKAADLISKLVKRGHEVHAVMTAAAARFIAPLTLQTLSRNPVLSSVFDETEDWRPGHIDLADRAQLLLVAPATANTIASLAHGLANDALTEIALATEAPLLIAPAMNGKMWKHPATQANVATAADPRRSLHRPGGGPARMRLRRPRKALERGRGDRARRAVADHGQRTTDHGPLNAPQTPHANSVQACQPRAGAAPPWVAPLLPRPPCKRRRQSRPRLLRPFQGAFVRANDPGAALRLPRAIMPARLRRACATASNRLPPISNFEFRISNFPP